MAAEHRGVEEEALEAGLEELRKESATPSKYRNAIASSSSSYGRAATVASIKKRENGKWRARYRDDDGKEHARHFDRRVDAQTWQDEQTAKLVAGSHVSPRTARSPAVQYPPEPLKTETSRIPVPVPESLALTLSAHVAVTPRRGQWLPGKNGASSSVPVRHYFASLLIASGADVKVVQAA